MTISETINQLVTSEYYYLERIYIDDQFIEMVRKMLPNDYDKIKQKEEQYQNMLNTFKQLKK